MHRKKVPKNGKRKSKPNPRRSLTVSVSVPKQTLDDKNRKMMAIFSERSMSTADRAQMAVFELTEHGMDYIPALCQIMKDRDESGKVDDMMKSLGQEPLATERYLGPAKISGLGMLAAAISGVQYVWVTSKDGVSCLPCEIKDLKVGDLVVISPKAQRIVGRDGSLLNAGYVVTVESLPEETGGMVVVKAAGDTMAVAWLHHSLLENPPKPGDKVIYDERHRFVLDRVNTDTKGDELLASLGSLPIVRRHEVGSPHPISEQIVNHFRDAIEHPEWAEQLGSRARKSYLFIGQTGGGKSYHIKLIATEIHDLVEQYTGTRQSRVFLCDASQFWSPYFGETEQRITNWAKKVEKLGSQKLVDKKGKEISVPMLGVIEEAEALFRSRGGDQHASGHLFDRVLALLLQKLESVENAIGVPIVWVCSTNRPDLIDAAAMRRIGMRKAIFGNLNPDAARKVMLTKTATLKVDGEKLAENVVDYLYNSEDGQELAHVTFQGGKKRPLNRRDIITPSILEEAVSSAVDACMTKSRDAGRLQRVDAADMIVFLHNHFTHLAGILNPHNVPEHCPEWFAEDATPVVNVKVAARS